MEPITNETTEVVPTPDIDARKFNNLTKTYERMSYEQLENILRPVITDTIARARSRAQLAGFSGITERFELKAHRSDEVHDCVQIIRQALAVEFEGTHQVFGIYLDTSVEPSPSDYFSSNAKRDFTFVALPL